MDGFGAEKGRQKLSRFTDLQVWRKSHYLLIRLLVDLQRIPWSRTAAVLIDQTVRSLGSIGANISEGFNRSKAKFLNCLDIALGEAHEAENWLYKLRDAGYLASDRAKPHIAECIEVQKMLTSLKASISKRPD
jgi:four helix bundle protein